MKKIILTVLLTTSFLSLTACSIVGTSAQEKADKFEMKYQAFSEDFRRESENFISDPTEESAKRLKDLNNKKGELIQEANDITKEAQKSGEVISSVTISGLKTITSSLKETSTVQIKELEENMDKFKNVIDEELYSDLKDGSGELIDDIGFFFEKLGE